MVSMLFLGASGQTGGAFLTVFRKQYPNILITAFLRSTELDTALQSLGKITIIHGTFDEYDKVEELAATHEIIINCAVSLNPPLTEAILKGIHATKTSEKPILLHLSGAGNFVDGSKTGNYIPQERPFNDANPDQVRKIDASYPPNGATDELILKAAASGYANALFVCPAGIYGTSTNHIGRSVGAKSVFAPGVWVSWSLENVTELGFSPYIGDGTAITRSVHVDDVVELMMLVFQKALDTWDSYKPEDVYKHFYVAVDEVHTTKPVAEAFGQLLYRRGKIASPAAKKVPYEEAGKVAGYIGGNLLVENDNAKSLGWRPRGPGLIETLRETEAV